MEVYEMIEALKTKAGTRLQDVPCKPLEEGGWKVYRKSLKNRHEAKVYTKALLTEILEYLVKESNRAKEANKGLSHKVDKGDVRNYRTGVKAEWASDRMFNEAWCIDKMKIAMKVAELFGLFN